MPQSGPYADEIVVDRVKAFRFAERNGTFDGIHAEMNTKVYAQLQGYSQD